MNGIGLPAEPDWKQFLNLGQQLLQQPSTAGQTNLIVNTISAKLDCEARVWLVSHYYPLPGEPDMETLPNAAAPDPVQEAFSTQQIAFYSEPDGLVTGVAIPLLEQGNLLGVVFAWGPSGPSFTPTEIEYLKGLSAHASLTMQFTRQVMLKNWRYEQLLLVRSVSDQVSNVLDLDELCRQVTHLIRDTFNYYYVGIFTLSDGGDSVVLKAGASQVDSIFLQPGFVILKDEGFVGYVASTGEEVLASNVHEDERYRYIDTLPHTQSEMTVPLKVENRLLGVLDVQSDKRDAFHEIDQLVLRSLANNIALAIEGTHLYSDLRHNNEQMSSVVEISHAITSILDLDELLEEVVELIQKRFGFPFVHIFTVHPGRSKVIYRRGSGARSQAMQEIELQYDLNDPMGIIPWVARTGKTRLVNDVEEEPLYRPALLPPVDTRSELAIPLKFAGDVLGVLDLQSLEVNAFKESDLEVFEVLCSNIAVAIRNASLYRSERWRRQVADSMRDVAGLISSNLAIDTLLDRILTELERHLPCEASSIWLLDENYTGDGDEGSSLHLAAVHGLTEAELLQAMQNPSAEAWMKEALQSKRPLIRKQRDPFGPLGKSLHAPKDYSSIATPMRSGDRPIGLLSLAHHSKGRYGSEAVAMTSTFANYAAVAVQNARLLADAQAQAWVSTVLLQVSEASRASETVEDLLDTMVRLTPLLVGVKKCGIYLWEENRQAFVLKSWYGLNPRRSSLAFDEHTVPAFARLRAAQSTLFIQDATAELNLPHAGLSEGGTLVLMPLLAHGDLLGAFLVGHQPDHHAALEQAFDQQILAILQGIAHQIATALENLSLIETRQEEGYVTAVMLQVAQAVANQTDLDDVLDTIVHLMPILVGIDACLIYLWDPAAQEFYPAQAFTGKREEEELLMCHSFAPGEYELLDRVMEGRTLFSPMSQPDIPLEEWPDLVSISAEDFSTLAAFTNSSWLIGFPLSIKGETFGVLIAKDTGVSPAFRERRVEIISGIAQQVALAIQNERLNLEKIERERMDREFQLAREIQQTFLPSYMPKLDGWEVQAEWNTARTVGGDFYDIFRIGEKKLALVIADVSDKGLAAAMYMTVTRTLIRANARATDSPAALVEQVNNLLVVDAQNGMFVTAVFALVDLETGQVTYTNAGHNQPLLIKGADGKVEWLHKGGMAMAVMENNKYVDNTITLRPGDALFLYTDGVTEQFSPDGDMFGEERMVALVEEHAADSLEALHHAVDQALSDFREGEPSSDDVTMLSIRRLPEPETNPDHTDVF